MKLLPLALLLFIAFIMALVVISENKRYRESPECARARDFATCKQVQELIRLQKTVPPPSHGQ